MICGFCGREIPEEKPQAACGQCLGGCRQVHCPWCGYKNPLPPAALRRWLKKKDPQDKESS